MCNHAMMDGHLIENLVQITERGYSLNGDTSLLSEKANARRLRIEFSASANNFKEAALELLRKWEQIEMETGVSPSDVPGYPLESSLDDVVLAIIDWNHNVNEWANKE
jgi:hypothetical protein